MKKKYYKRQPGDFEIRILRDGRTIFVSPNEAMLDVARILNADNPNVQTRKETTEHVRTQIEE
jgi:hypothetical protein